MTSLSTRKINEKTKTAEITVPEDQLSLAIGREGQNARLAAKLTGYKINLKGSKGSKHTAKKDDLEHEIDKLELSSRTRNSLVEAGITTIADLRKKTDSQLAEIRGLGPKSLTEIKEKLG